MRTTVTRVSVFALATLTVFAGLLPIRSTVIGQRAAAPSVVRITPDQLKWVDEPDGLGFKTANVEGDPKKAGLYIIQVKFPPWVMSKPHFHREDRYATVIKGTWYTGAGDDFLPDKTVALKPGSYMKHPAGAHHFDGAKDEEVIIQIVGMGPSETTKMHPQEGLFASSKGK
jgi:quercetin dioxygenase-like cupin family protein